VFSQIILCFGFLKNVLLERWSQNIYSVTHLFSVVRWWTYQDAKHMRGALIAIKAVTRHSNITVQCQTNGEYSDVEKKFFLMPFIWRHQTAVCSHGNV